MLQDDQKRMVISMLACIPLSYVIPKLPSTLLREVYSLLLGTVIQYYIYGTEIYLVFLLHVFMYLLTWINPKKCGSHVTIVSLVLLSIYHIYRMSIDYGGWNLDVSTIMMSNVNKYSLFAYAYQDGKTDLSKLTPQQIKQRQQKLPSFFRFLGYCQFLPASPISLSFPYKYFQQYMQQKQQYKSIPSPWRAVGYEIIYAIVMILIYLLNVFVFPLKTMQDPQFANNGFWYIILFSIGCVTTLRFKYYFGWKLSLGAIHASGVSHQQKADKTNDFKLIQTCNPVIVETTMHVRDKIANWNMTTQEWLRKCVYQRSPFQNKSNGQLLTFMVSAFWHGFYGGYYVSFILWFSHVFVSQLVFKESKKQKSPWVKLYKMLGPTGWYILWVVSNGAFTVSGIFFQVLSINQSFKILQSLYFTPFILYFVGYVLFTFGATRGSSLKDRKTQHGKDFPNGQRKEQTTNNIQSRTDKKITKIDLKAKDFD